MKPWLIVMTVATVLFTTSSLLDGQIRSISRNLQVFLTAIVTAIVMMGSHSTVSNARQSKSEHSGQEQTQADAVTPLPRSASNRLTFPLEPSGVTALPAVPVTSMTGAGDTIYLDCGVVVSAVSTTTGELLWNRAVSRQPRSYSQPVSLVSLALPEGVLVIDQTRQSELILLGKQDGQAIHSWPITPTSLYRTEAGRVFCLLGNHGLSQEPDIVVELDIAPGGIKREIRLTPGHWTRFDRPHSPNYDLRAFRLGEITGTGGWLYVQGANTLVTLSPDGKPHGLRYVSSFVPAISGPTGTVLVGDRGALLALDKRLLDKHAPKYSPPPAAYFNVGYTWEPVLAYQNGTVVRAFENHLDAFDIIRHRPLWSRKFPPLDVTYRPLSPTPLIAGNSVISVVGPTLSKRRRNDKSSKVTSLLMAHSLDKGHVQWTFPVTGRVLSLMVHQSHLYVVQIGADGLQLTRFDSAPVQAQKSN